MNEQQQLQSAIALLQSKQAHKAYEQLHSLHIQLSASGKKNPQVDYFLGASLHTIGKITQAVPFFANAFSEQPTNLQLKTSFLQVSKEALNKCIANKDYQELFSLPDKVALLNSGNSLNQRLLNSDERVSIDLIFAKAYRLQENFPASLVLLEAHEPTTSNNQYLLHDYALSLRLVGQPDRAIICYEKLISAGLDNPVVYQNYANALSDKGDYTGAIQNYAKVLTQQVFNFDVLNNTLDALWESGQQLKLFQLVESTLSKPACPILIYRLFFDKLSRIQALDEASSVLEKMEEAFPDNTQSKYCRVIFENTVNTEKTQIRTIEDLFAEKDLPIPEQLELIQLLISKSQLASAKQYLQAIIAVQARNQLALALAHTLSRLGEPIDHPVVNLDDYVFEYNICDPNGNSDEKSVADFLEQLKTTLVGLHTASNQPIAQSLHKGTQTRGHLFANEDKAIAHIKSQYKLAVVEYSKNPKNLPALYPGFWDSANIDFSGSWSVLLSQSGFHNNHIHSKGWLSSAFYVALPELNKTKANAYDNKEGWFQYGQAKIDTMPALPPSEYVKPEIGKIVLFPSCLWHGTVPFNTGDIRLTIACDIVKQK